MELKDLSQGTLLGLSIIFGSYSVELFSKGLYWVALAFLVFTAVVVGFREYFKLD